MCWGSSLHKEAIQQQSMNYNSSCFSQWWRMKYKWTDTIIVCAQVFTALLLKCSIELNYGLIVNPGFVSGNILKQYATNIRGSQLIKSNRFKNLFFPIEWVTTIHIEKDPDECYCKDRISKWKRLDSCMNKNNIRHPNRRAVEKTVADIEAYYVKQAKN